MLNGLGTLFHERLSRKSRFAVSPASAGSRLGWGGRGSAEPFSLRVSRLNGNGGSLPLKSLLGAQGSLGSAPAALENALGRPAASPASAQAARWTSHVQSWTAPARNMQVRGC